MENSFFFKEFSDAQEHVIETIKILLFNRHADIFDRINFEDDSIYQDPHFYTYLVQKDDKWIDSIIFGYEISKKQNLEVFTNSKGVICLPNFGYLITELPNANLSLSYVNNRCVLHDSSREVKFEFEQLLFLNNGIEVIKTLHPLLENYFCGSDQENIINYNKAGEFPELSDRFKNAFAVIANQYPPYYDLLKKSVKRVVFFEGKLNSFAAIQAHNTVFLNSAADCSEVFYLDHILHEGAHVIFNTLTFKSKHDLFTVNFDDQMSKLTGDLNDHDEIYGRFHGLFTQTNINLCLERCVSDHVYDSDSDLEYELIGRFTSNLKRFSKGISLFDRDGIFKSEGLKWFRFFKKTYSDVYERNKELIAAFDVSNQPYVFSYKLFKETNPKLD